MLAVMAVAGAIADFINLPGIVGAFLAGLAVNSAVQDNPARTKLEFFGKALFIPSFFIVTGLVIDPVVFAADVVDHFPLALGIVVALLAGKWIAAAAGARIFGYAPAARSTMWALTLPQVAATLAAAVVAFDTRNGAGQRIRSGELLVPPPDQVRAARKNNALKTSCMMGSASAASLSIRPNADNALRLLKFYCRTRAPDDATAPSPLVCDAE